MLPFKSQQSSYGIKHSPPSPSYYFSSIAASSNFSELRVDHSFSTKVLPKDWEKSLSAEINIQSTLPKSNIQSTLPKSNLQVKCLFKSSSLYILLFLTPHKSNFPNRLDLSRVDCNSEIIIENIEILLTKLLWYMFRSMSLIYINVKKTVLNYKNCVCIHVHTFICCSRTWVNYTIQCRH